MNEKQDDEKQDDETQEHHEKQALSGKLSAAPRLAKFGAAGAAAVAIAVGAYALGSSGSDDASTTSAFPGGATGQVPALDGQQSVAPSGDVPASGGVTEVTGDTADKVEEAVLAERDGTVEGVDALPDGSYLAHLATDDGEVYVTVSSDFEVTGTVDLGSQAPPSSGTSTGTESAS